MNYFDYMMHKHLNGNDRFADLAKDMNVDCRFPKTDDYDEIYEYLVYERGACTGCVDVFKESYEMYRNEGM